MSKFPSKEKRKANFNPLAKNCLDPFNNFFLICFLLFVVGGHMGKELGLDLSHGEAHTPFLSILSFGGGYLGLTWFRLVMA